METIKSYAGVVALVVLAIMGVSGLLKGSSHLAGSTSCASITCLAGGLRLVSDLGGTFEVDVASTFNAALALVGNLTVTGNETVSGTLGVTATTTLSDTVNFNNPGLCINFYATSSNTRLHLVASTTATLPNGAAAVMTAEYGACAL